MAGGSEAYHAHPKHPDDCETYHDVYGRRCPCERYQPEVIEGPFQKAGAKRAWGLRARGLRDQAVALGGEVERDGHTWVLVAATGARTCCKSLGVVEAHLKKWV